MGGWLGTGIQVRIVRDYSSTPAVSLVRFLQRAEPAIQMPTDAEEWSWMKLEMSNGAVTRAALQFSATTHQAISKGTLLLPV